MSTADLPHSTPSAEGVDPAGLESFLDAVAAHPLVELHSLIVLRHGKVIAEGWWAPYTPERVHLLYSLSKSFASTALGLAVAEGLVDLDATVLSYFPEFDADIVDERSRKVKVRHVAAMASGHLDETLGLALHADPAEPVRGFLLVPPAREPGTVFAYNQPCTYSLAAIVQRQSGQTLVDYLRPRLFEPLGIGEANWITDAGGRNIGFSGLHVTTDAIARFSQLYLQRGRWGDQQILSEAWVDEATSKQVDNDDRPDAGGPDGMQGYGFQFWRSQHGYRSDGAYGQFGLVLPDQDLVIAITAATLDAQALLDLVWTHVLPAVADDLPGDPAGDRRLADRLGGLSLTLVDGAAGPGDPEPWDGTSFVAPEPPPDPLLDGLGALPPTVTQAGLTRTDDGWSLALTDRGGTLEALVGLGEWASDESSGVPVAVSGAWTDADTFTARLWFLDTPHAVQVNCSRDGTARVDWVSVPLHPQTILDLRSPA